MDPRLAAALQKARGEAPGKSDAALIKELALRGSESATDGPSGSAIERILTLPGVRAPTRKLEPLLAELRETQKLDSETVDRILEEDRADRDFS